MKPTVVISLGGSLVCPNDVDIKFLKNFVKFVKGQSKKYRFIIVVGGGGTNRRYNHAAKTLGVHNPDDLDWIGIYASRLNAMLVRTLFGSTAEDVIQLDPGKRLPLTREVLVAAGFRPGHSTDFVAVRLAQTYGLKSVINLSDIEYVYDRDPKKHKSSQPIKKIAWSDFRKIVGSRWAPRLSMPFDPIASKLGESLNMRVMIADGRDLKNLENILSDKPFRGTLIG